MRNIVSALAFAFCALAHPVQASVVDHAQWLRKHALVVASGPESEPPQVPETLRDADVILLGEIHGLAHGQIADLALLKALHGQAGVRYYLGEFDAAQADAFNQLLESGDPNRIDSVFIAWRERGLQWANADFRDKLLAIAVWNAALPERERIRFLGVDEIQDRPAYCDWLRQRMRAGRQSVALNSLRAALEDPARCSSAGALAQAALADARELDPVTADGIAALATDASTDDREERIAANIARQLGLHRGRFYGLWGLSHVVKAEVNGTEPMALRLVQKGIRVRSIALLNLGGEMMMPMQAADGKIAYGTMGYTVDSADAVLVNGIEPFVAEAQAPLTLFTLDGEDSPFRNSDALTRVGGRLGQMQPFSIDPATAPGGFWSDAVLISRGSPATRPLQ